MAVFILELSLLEALDVDAVTDGPLAALAAIAATAYQPTRVVLRGVVDQLLFGERPDPLGAAPPRVPSVGPVLSNPLATSGFPAARRTVRLTPRVSHGVGSGGIAVPGR